MAGRLVMDIRTFLPLEDWEIGRHLLSPLFAQPELRPDKVAMMGEVTARHGVEVTDLEDCRPLWGMGATLSAGGVGHAFRAPFHWRRKGRAASTGLVTFPAVDRRGKPVAGGLAFQGRVQPGIDWLALFSRWCTALAPFAAMLHPAMDRESAPAGTDPFGIAEVASRHFQGGMIWCETTAGQLNSRYSGLTNAGWATFLGGKLADEVDAPALLSAGFDMQRLGEGWMIRTTPSIEHVASDFEGFRARRRRLRACFRDGLFLAQD